MGDDRSAYRLWIGLIGVAVTLLTLASLGMPDNAWSALGLVWWMAAWWMTEALPLSATAFLPLALCR